MMDDPIKVLLLLLLLLLLVMYEEGLFRGFLIEFKRAFTVRRNSDFEVE